MKFIADVTEILGLGVCAGIGTLAIYWLLTGDLDVAWWFGAGAFLLYLVAASLLKRDNHTF